MNALEKGIRSVKGSLGLTSRSPAVTATRPVYDAVLNLLYGRSGLPRLINGQETIRVLPAQRYAEEGYEPAVFEYIKSHIAPGAVVLDIGAHIGLSSILMARWSAPGGRIYAFEPTPRTRKILEAHLALNGFSDAITVVPMAVSDHCGTDTFYSYADSPEATLSQAHGRLPGAVANQVEVTTVDAFCASHQVSPTLIKIDIEGFEFHALRGARETLKRCNPAVVIEFHSMNWPEIGITQQAALAEITELGYVAKALEGQPDPYAKLGHVALERIK